MKCVVNSAEAMASLGAALAGQLNGGEIIYLQGPLGAGKTTLTRGLLRGLGFSGNVKSPTYTLVEHYELNGMQVFHFDLYRLNDPEELEDMGIRDYCDESAVLLFEWPERATDILPEADILFSIAHIDDGRHVTVESRSETGKRLAKNITSAA